MSDSFLERLAKKRGESRSDGVCAVDEYLNENCPELFEFLCRDKLNGRPRKVGSISFFFDEGRLKFVLSDKQDGMVGFGTCGSAETAWDDANEMLVKDTLEWRKSRR